MKKAVKWLLEEKYQGERSEGFLSDVERLEAGEPLAYVIGYVPFLNTKIYLDSHPLIPRPETEFWVEKAITDMTSRSNLEFQGSTLKVLDLCAGSGCIGVAVAHAIPEALVDFAELDEKNHSNILKNIRMNNIEESRVRIFGGDLFEQLADRQGLSGKYDYILSNPPYIDPCLDRTETSVKNYEPHRALYGGEGGLEIITRIIHESPAHLKEHGLLYLEHEPEQSAAITVLAAQNGFDAKTEKDQYGIERYTLLKKRL